MSTETTQLIEGPAWSKPGLDVVAGRFPLRVETHVSRMVSRLLPGVITVTPHARYFELHPLVYSEIRKRDIDYRVDGPEFMRRCEVVIGAVPRSTSMPPSTERCTVRTTSDRTLSGMGTWTSSRWLNRTSTRRCCGDSPMPTTAPRC